MPWLMWLSWLEHHPVNQSVMSSTPSQGAYRCCRFDLWLECVQEATNQSFSLTLMFLFLSLFPPPGQKNKNKFLKTV